MRQSRIFSWHTRANAALHSCSGILDSFTAHQTNNTSAPLLMCLLTCLPPQQFSTNLSQNTRERAREGEREKAAAESIRVWVVCDREYIYLHIHVYTHIQAFVHSLGMGLLVHACEVLGATVVCGG